MLLIFFGIEISYSQTAVQTQNVRLKPSGNANGLVGNMAIKYAFNNCFGDAFMGYGYGQKNIQYLIYNGEKLYPSDLNISNFSDYVILARAEVNIYKISSGSKVLVKSKSLNNMDKNNSFGCYSIGVNIGKEEKDNLQNLRASFDNVELSYNASLSSKAKNMIAKREKEKNIRKLLFK